MQDPTAQTSTHSDSCAVPLNSNFSDRTIGIRRYQSSDVPLLLEAVRESVAEVAPWLPWCHSRYSERDSEKWVNSRDAAWTRGEEYSFVIHEVAAGRFLGGVGINLINRVYDFANLGYWVRSSRTGRGVATAAVRLAARFGFEEAKLHRLEIVVAAGNRASERVAEKAGAHREGVLRKRLWRDGAPCDAVLFSLVAEDLGLQPAPRAN